MIRRGAILSRSMIIMPFFGLGTKNGNDATTTNK